MTSRSILVLCDQNRRNYDITIAFFLKCKLCQMCSHIYQYKYTLIYSLIKNLLIW